ncbi:MAG: methyltransferase domain-containing protein [Caulobacteraceae bacterium]
MPDFARRTLTPELMDTEACDFATFRACLVDLAVVNRLTLAYRPTVDFFDRLARAGKLPAGRPTRVLDVGAGYGDMLRVLDRWAQRRGVQLEMVGADLNPFSARAANEVTAAGRPIRWITADALSLPGDPPDVVISSLFAHHLDDDQLVSFLAWSERAARVGWFVNDLHRHAFPFHGFGLLARLMRWHRFVIHDGPVSIARAFEAGDWRDLLREAGLPKGAAKVVWRFPFRLCVERVKP